jgi:hypothetical protein
MSGRRNRSWGRISMTDFVFVFALRLAAVKRSARSCSPVYTCGPKEEQRPFSDFTVGDA